MALAPRRALRRLLGHVDRDRLGDVEIQLRRRRLGDQRVAVVKGDLLATDAQSERTLERGRDAQRGGRAAVDPRSDEPAGVATVRRLRGPVEALLDHDLLDRHPPLVPHARARAPTHYPFAVMQLILSVVQVIIAVVLIFLVLLHSGKDAGLSGAFGVGSGAGPLGGGSLVEKNLNRWTIGFAIVFAINTIILVKL